MFKYVGKILRQKTRKKVKPTNAKNVTVFSTSFNPHGLRVNIIK